MRILRKIVIVILILVLLLVGFYFLYMRPRYVVPILMYHGVTEGKEGSLFVTPENFSEQMKYLHSKGYNVISLHRLVKGITNGEEFSAGTVVITFDDGFEDNYRHAFPILRKYQMPATIFLITGYIGKDPEYLDWDQIALMLDNGIAFGGHTRNDIYLPSLKERGKLKVEIAGSKEDIEEATNRVARYFCYPIGGFNETIKEIVKESGYKGACTTNRGSDRYNKDVFELTRVKVTNSDMTKPFHFRAKLSGYYNLFRSMKSPE